MSSDLALDVATCAERFARLSAGECARYVEAIARGSAEGRADDERAMLACALWLARLDKSDRRTDGARRAAREGGLRVAELLLEDSGPMRVLGARARRPQAGPSGIDRLLLGASTRHRAPSVMRLRLTERLVASYVHPSVAHTQRLLAEPGLTVRDVVAMTSRRPTTPELLAEVAASARWVRDARVREALVLNPYTPASIAARLLPTLPILRRASADPSLHPRVREVARALLSAATGSSC